MLVQAIMRKDVVWVKPDASIAYASQLMLEKGVRSVVVCDGNLKVIGIVTDTDILARSLGKFNIHETPVKEIMTKNPVTTSPDANVIDLVKIMGEKKFRRMPVVDENKKLLGIISIGDIAPHIMLQIELLRGTL